MIKRTFEQIALACGGTLNKKAETLKDNYIEGVSIDTRTIETNNLFIPFKGENVDGHRFIDMAFDKGAALTLSEQDDMESSYPTILVEDGLKALQKISQVYLNEIAPKVVAVTGSNGKTTTKDMIECVLNKRYKVQKTIGNFNNEIGMPLTILQLEADTEVSILEMGMDRLKDISFLSQLAKPDIAVITSVGESHIEMLGSRENIAKAKYEIVDELKDEGTFIYSKDYPLLENIVKKDVPYTLKTAGLNEENEALITDISANGEGTQFTFKGEVVSIPQLGAHNALNASLAILVAESLGVSLAESKANLENLKVTTMRMERIEDKSGALIINDAYNASKASMISAIDTMSQLDYTNKILVLGDILELGSYSKELHEAVGHFINELPTDFTYIYTFGEHTEYIHNILETKNKMHIWTIEDLRDQVTEHLNKDTAILLKGSRGMALERVIQDR
ncbi:UDP-N-acetylmuramoyl-tripeptide--D-alanyl-D-alanine ligase [Jeotgalicoccus huakuii]|uniref:UDP-N-acetylmuramoyl-tripeptide--D-alanyl-D- alanine ligase n=1 Tax=Jeotgalicoccus sp. S0W5 TaxID=2527874 RepID=UPI001414F852|nr:UDP-N-acetylmuramoyl-tripeptide--D-alanyl-D-alanine ligase [Jeotgalicoccus sp. S0W5]MCK1975831.1 UDP-N-acetylmuramoyl-tripeptide--D-alanyl-D-alanine ligase [Jeotgalicoccus huakuii]